jgi:opacity protein-like surface antigen
MKKFILGALISAIFVASITAMEYDPNTVLINATFGAGTFSAGEYDGGSIFLGASISTDWIPNGNIGLSYGVESGLLGGQKQNNNIILGVPLIFRFGWHPNFIKMENIDLFVLSKIGWGFGLWGSNLDNDSTSGGIVCGINIGVGYKLTQRINAYTEIGYNYYGLARNSNYPEYPLGYGSGKVYASIGVSLKLFKEKL